jgi:L-iditol 2-dehydrogenase
MLLPTPWGAGFGGSAMEKMRASRLVGHGDVACEEVEVTPPSDGEVLVRMAYASICGTDLHAVFPHGGAVRGNRPPGNPGHEGVGEVVESRFDGLTPGDRVLTVPDAFAGRCFAEYQTVRGEACIVLPTDGDLTHLLMAQQLGTVLFAFRQHPVDVTGRDVAIIGQGSAGAFWTWLLRRQGAASIVVSDLSSERLAYATEMGADVAVDANAADLRDAVMASTGGRGADIVVEAVGSADTFLASTRLAARDATLVWFGTPDGSPPLPLDYGAFFGKRLTAFSTFGSQNEPGLASFRWAIDLIARGEIDVAPLLSHILPLEQIGDAFRIAHERTDGALKVSVKC